MAGLITRHSFYISINMMVHVIVICGSEQQILFSCLASLKSQNIALSITVIDNASVINDITTFELLTSEFSYCELIHNSIPRGFASNNNVGLRAIPRGVDFVLLLNDDTIVHEHALENLLKKMELDGKIGAANPLLLNSDGSRQWSEQQLRFPNEWRTIFQIVVGHRLASSLSHISPSSSWLNGACLMLRIKALQEVGIFDEGFDPGYAEDVDLCHRLAKHGWQLVICDEARVTHIGGMSFKAGSVNRHANRFQGYFRYMAKWGSKSQRVCTKLAWLFSIAGRLIMSAFLHGMRIPNGLPAPAMYVSMLKGYTYALRHERS